MFMPQYRWNTAKVGVKHQSINQVLYTDAMVLIFSVLKKKRLEI
jgi:hypothetical protein